jgi:hypothetical protein
MASIEVLAGREPRSGARCVARRVDVTSSLKLGIERQRIVDRGRCRERYLRLMTPPSRSVRHLPSATLGRLRESGTRSSNPVSSTGESDANLTIVRLRRALLILMARS